uniref:BTB domain-containing protein n=1 Tax=Syphacia muris TaxID=451379 RepID=A0A0N5ARG2_9BILA
MGCLIVDESELQKAAEVLLDADNSADIVPFVENIKRLWLSGYGCDIHFAVGIECKRFSAHRIILAAGSKYFYEFFFGNERKAGTCSYEYPIEIFDVTPEAMDVVLNFLYSNQNPASVKLDAKCVVHVLYAAEKYQINNLRLAALRYIQNMNGKNCIEILRQAMFYKEELLVKKCLNVIDKNADEILTSEGFLDCDRSTIEILVNRDTFQPSREFPLFMALFSWSIMECDRLGIDINATNQRDVLGGLMVLVNLQALTKDEVADAVRTGLVTAEEVAQFVSNPWDPKITNLFKENEEVDAAHSKQSSELSNDLYYTVSRFQHTLKSSTTMNSIKLNVSVNRNVDIVGFSIFGFCDGRNSEIFQYKPYVTLRRVHNGIHMMSIERVETDIIPFKHLIRFMFKEKRRFKRDKKYCLEVKSEGMAQRTRYEGFGDISSVIKLHNGDSVTFAFDGDRYLAELYFVPGENLERIAMLPLRTDFIRNLAEASSSSLKLHGSRWTS